MKGKPPSRYCNLLFNSIWIFQTGSEQEVSALWRLKEAQRLKLLYNTGRHRGAGEMKGTRVGWQALLPGCTQSLMMFQKSLLTWPSSHSPALALSPTTSTDVFLSYACSRIASIKLLTFFFKGHK